MSQVSAAFHQPSEAMRFLREIDWDSLSPESREFAIEEFVSLIALLPKEIHEAVIAATQRSRRRQRRAQPDSGKIAGLPAIIRDEVSLRLAQGDLPSAIADWLNRQTEVQRILSDRWRGRPIEGLSVTAWSRSTGHKKWLTRTGPFVERLRRGRAMLRNIQLENEQ